MNGLTFNANAVLQVTMICAGILFVFVVIGILFFFLIELVERDCRRDFNFDREGRRDDSKGH